MTQTYVQEANKDLNLNIEENTHLSVFEFANKESASAESASEIHIAANARLNYVSAFFGGAKLSKSMHFILEEGAELNYINIFLGDNNEEHSVKAFVEHAGPNSNSKMRVKGILKDKAVSAFKGTIRINKEAQKSQGDLEQRVLLLSKYAVAEGQPELEILADDVKASHAAAVGRIDREQIFYMQSRGISERDAKAMITQGFLDSLINNIEEEDVKAKITELFHEKLQTSL